MSQLQLAYKHSAINYYVYGTGSKVLFCLHGYGENGSSFAFLENQLGRDFTMYAIDLPFHGATRWNEHEAFTPGDLVSVLDLVFPGKRSFSVIAYSMGGRAAMHLLQQIPASIERAVLLAPDGLHVNFWYWLATQTSVGNKLFNTTMKHPYWFFTFLDTAGKLRILNNSIIRFVHHFLDDENERTLLYKRWTVMRKFEPDLAAVAKISSEENIPVHFVFGSYDRIILSKRSKVFEKEKNIHIQILEAGHQLLKEKYAPEIASLLYN